ncbi:MAG: ExeA family protein [Acidiferrobacteraceae bacterium]
MYTHHFGLNEMPFTITPDTSFFFAHPMHQQALNTLLIAVRLGEGFIKVTGEVGTGKTLICRKLLAALEQDTKVLTAYVPNPYLSPAALLGAIADELGVPAAEHREPHQLLKQLTSMLLEIHQSGRRVVLCLDEAQAMPVGTLEALRLLSNLETEKRKLLQVVLFGQPELDVKLADPSIRQLLQRITFSCKLRPLGFRDIRYYVAHRLAIAGHSGGPVFSTPAIWKLARASKGIPRIVNILSHKAMLAAFGEGGRRVALKHVREAARDTESVGAVVPALSRYVVTVFVALLVSAGALFWIRVR